MSKMSPQQFERVLHPIFEEDELTLILVGGFLGALAGFAQQVVEMQKMGTLPESWVKWLRLKDISATTDRLTSSWRNITAVKWYLSKLGTIFDNRLARTQLAQEMQLAS